MIQETLVEVKRKIEEADSISNEKKKELLDLFAILQSEIQSLAATNREHAESIAGFTQASAHEAIRKEKSERLHQLSLEGLAGTVEGFEKSYPRLVEVVNSISIALSNLGV